MARSARVASPETTTSWRTGSSRSWPSNMGLILSGVMVIWLDGLNSGLVRPSPAAQLLRLSFRRETLPGEQAATIAMASARAALQLRRQCLAAGTNPFLFSGHGLRYRKLEVILTTSIDKLGKAGEVVKVAPGHFRNHLMPKMLAVPNIDKFAILIREQRKLYQREEEEAVKVVTKEDDDARQHEEKLKEYQAAAKRLDNALLVLRRFISTGNELRTPVTKDEIVSEVARQLNINIHPDNLHLQSPLASLGEFELPLRLPKDIPRTEGKLQWTLKVKIRRK